MEVKKMNEKVKNKLAIPLLALAIVGIAGSMYTFSQASPTSVRAQSVTARSATRQVQPQNAGDKEDPSYTSSVKAPESATEVDEATEAKRLASLAKISEANAKTAAEKSAGGKATSVKLENENGNIVYEVIVGNKEVKVDAGNGAVLHTETADSGEVPNQAEGEK